jgi:hypothetical protein
MFEIDAQTKILLGNSLPLPEEDLDDYQEDELAEEDALRQYYFQIIVSAMGKDDFKNEFLSVFDIMQRENDYEKQKMLCIAMMEKVNEIYDFEFNENIDFTSEQEIEEFYEFVKFYEYDHEDFLVRVWKFVTDRFPKDLDTFIEKSENNIILEIEDQIDSFNYNGMITQFLGTNTRTNMIQWFREKSKRIIPTIKYHLGEE